MPPASDWRSARTAEKLMRLDRPQFAVEFLRRHPGYNDDYRNTQDQIASGSLAPDAGMERLARRWGLTFPACAQRPCMGIACHLEARIFPLRCRDCSVARTVRSCADHPHR